MEDWKIKRQEKLLIQATRIAKMHYILKTPQNDVIDPIMNEKVVDYDLIAKGEKWFNSGKTLEEATDELKKAHFFVVGYNRAKRLAFIRELEMNKGREFYNNGGILELLSDEEKAKLSENFILGYEEARFKDETNSNKQNKTR